MIVRSLYFFHLTSHLTPRGFNDADDAVSKQFSVPSRVDDILIRLLNCLFLFGVITGACYAEFGVRVPHTTGSAYMYSYVTVGELIAFIIGWNMVLEYLIGTSACACALSACLDALANGAISGGIANSVGTILGKYQFHILPTHANRQLL